MTGLKGLGKADRIKPVPGLDNNPADDGMVFGKSHPYITKAYPGAEKAVSQNIHRGDYTGFKAGTSGRKDCAAWPSA